MARQSRSKRSSAVVHTEHSEPENAAIQLVWIRVAYGFHTFAYRDPRAAFSSAVGIPIVSPTAVLLGVVSTLFCLGRADEAVQLIHIVHECRVTIDPPEGVIFFRAFHQLRRYETDQIMGSKEKFKPNPRVGLTKINQGTREYGLVDGTVSLYVGVPEQMVDAVKAGLLNRSHLGTHDSLCTVMAGPDICSEPVDVPFWAPERWQTSPPSDVGLTVLMLSRFKPVAAAPTVGNYWWMAGGVNTELAPFLIKGYFSGTSGGKIFRKHRY